MSSQCIEDLMLGSVDDIFGLEYNFCDVSITSGNLSRGRLYNPMILGGVLPKRLTGPTLESITPKFFVQLTFYSS